jgi:hypothetical protein
LDSDDRWLTEAGVCERVDEILRRSEDVTVGFAEGPLSLNSEAIRRRLQRWGARLADLGRAQTTADDVTVYHWAVAELIASEALFSWWSTVADWPLGWWPWDHGDTTPPIPGA